MATATMPPRGRNQNQPPAPAAPANPPAAPAPAPPAPVAPAPRPVTPRVAVDQATVLIVGLAVENVAETIARDNAESDRLRQEDRRRQAELAESEHRRESFSHAVRWVIGIVVILGIAGLLTWAVLTAMATDDNSTVVQPLASPLANTSTSSKADISSPPAPPATDAMSASASAQVNIFNYCGGAGCMTLEVLHPSPTVKAHCLDNHPNKLRAQFEECCGRIPNPTERAACLAGIGQIPRK